MDYLTTHTSLSPIQPGFVNYKKGCTRFAAASEKAYQLRAHGWWFSPGTPASSTTKTGCHDIAEILLKVALNTKIIYFKMNESPIRYLEQIGSIVLVIQGFQYISRVPVLLYLQAVLFSRFEQISWISYIKLFKIRRYQIPFKLCKKSSWLYGSWIYNYPCNQCLSPLTLWVRIPFRRGVFDTTLGDNVCKWLAIIFSRYYFLLPYSTTNIASDNMFNKFSIWPNCDNKTIFQNNWNCPRL